MAKNQIELIENVVNDNLQIEIMKSKVSLIPCISEEEQIDIEKLYKKPSSAVAYSINLDIQLK